MYIKLVSIDYYLLKYRKQKDEKGGSITESHGARTAGQGQGQGQQRNVVIGKTKERHGWVVCSYYEVWGK